MADNKKVISPRLVRGSEGESVFNVYAKCAKNKVTVRTVTVGLDMRQSMDSEEANQTEGTEQNENSDEASEETPRESMSSSDNQSVMSSGSDSDSNPANISANYVRQSFNNRETSDLLFDCSDAKIYCHKTILEIRNKKFWQTVSQKMNANNEICLNRESHGVFFAFLQYIYGLEPEINEAIVADLQTMAKYFCEPQLSYLCSQYIKYFDRTPNLSNVCSLYEKAMKESSEDLEMSCVEFAKHNWKSLVKSEAFQMMNASIAKRLMCSVFRN